MINDELHSEHCLSATLQQLQIYNNLIMVCKMQTNLSCTTILNPTCFNKIIDKNTRMFSILDQHLVTTEVNRSQLQSNLVITNFTGPSILARYNYDSRYSHEKLSS